MNTIRILIVVVMASCANMGVAQIITDPRNQLPGITYTQRVPAEKISVKSVETKEGKCRVVQSTISTPSIATFETSTIEHATSKNIRDCMAQLPKRWKKEPVTYSYAPSIFVSARERNIFCAGIDVQEQPRMYKVAFAALAPTVTDDVIKACFTKATPTHRDMMHPRTPDVPADPRIQKQREENEHI